MDSVLDSNGRLRDRVIHNVRVCPSCPVRLLGSIPDYREGIGHNIGKGCIEHGEFDVPIQIIGRLPRLATLIKDKHGIIDTGESMAPICLAQRALGTQSGVPDSIGDGAAFTSVDDAFSFVLWNGGVGTVAKSWSPHGHKCKAYYCSDEVAASLFRRHHPGVPTWKGLAGRIVTDRHGIVSSVCEDSADR